MKFRAISIRKDISFKALVEINERLWKLSEDELVKLYEDQTGKRAKRQNKKVKKAEPGAGGPEYDQGE